VIIAFDRQDCDDAALRCRELLALGEKLRDGSEAPFARSIAGLCNYVLTGDDGELDGALDALRAADAKHRLATVQIRAAQLDIGHGRYDNAVSCSAEALHCAQVLERSTETLLAHQLLAQAHRLRGDEAQYLHHVGAMQALDNTRVASWARDRADAFIEETVTHD
jgi:hypothetical protein